MRECEPVSHVLGSIVQAEAAPVHIGSALETLPPVEDIAKGFERPGGRGIERCRFSEVARRGIQIAALTVRLAAPEVRQHRFRTQRDGTAERLDRAKGLAVAQRHVAPAEQYPVLLFTRGRLIG